MSQRWLDDPDAWIVLAFAAAFAALLILVESRSNTFFNDEIAIFQRLGQGIDARSILEPHNGHLILPAHLIYAAIFAWFGPTYTALRVIGVVILVVCCTLFFVLAKRRVGPTTALIPAIVLLFLGSSWEALLWPLTMLTFGLATAFGLCALIALERGDLRGDLTACAFTVLAVISHSTGLAFLVGVGLAVILSGRARRRGWIVAFPALVYIAWWAWALRFNEGLAHPGNLLIVPQFMADSLAAVAAAGTGLGLDLGSGPVSLTVTPSWGYVIAPIAIVALVVRLARAPGLPLVWIAVVTLLVYWLALGLSFGPGGRTPFESRYLFTGALLSLLVAAAAMEGIRLSGLTLAAIIAIGIVSVLTNIKQLDNAEAFFRDYSPRARSALTAIEIARDSVSPDFRPQLDSRLEGWVPSRFPVEAGPYLEAVDRFGSSAFSRTELLRQDAVLREEADRVLAGAERLSLRSTSGQARGGCGDVPGRGRAGRELPPGTFRLEVNKPAEARLGRFAWGHPVDLGRVTPRRPVTLSIPADAEPRPWRIAIHGNARARICVFARS